MKKKNIFKMQMKRKWIIAGFAALIVGGVFCIGLIRMRGDSVRALAENAEVQTATVTTGDISIALVL